MNPICDDPTVPVEVRGPIKLIVEKSTKTAPLKKLETSLTRNDVTSLEDPMLCTTKTTE